MKTVLGFALFLLLGAAITANAKTNKMYFVRLETEKGNIDLELDGVHAPLNTQNFLNYLNHKLYDGGFFHRTVTRYGHFKFLYLSKGFAGT